MGNVYLPINTYWRQFYDRNVEVCAEKKTAATRKIVEAARTLAGDVDRRDVWMWAQDWTLNGKQNCYEWINKLFKVNLLCDRR